MENPKVSVILPVLNEQEGISKTLENIKLALKDRWTYEIICVDNGCTDASMSIAKEYSAQICMQPRKGYGVAIRTGFNKAKGDYLFTIDADCTYDFNDALPMIEALEDSADVCIGNRYGDQGIDSVYAYHRSIGNKMITWLISKRFGVTLKDCNCGLRGIRSNSLKSMKLKCTGMDFASELIIQAASKGMRIKEQPISYSSRVGISKLNSLTDGFAHFRLILSSSK